MLSSLYSGVTGINAAGYTMSVVGNNIANSNTIGFKGGYTAFADILSQSLGGAGGGNQVGRGVNLSEIGTLFTQGSFENTSNVTDIAIEGSGFFLVADDTGTYYTRAGQFIMDADGFLVNPSGYRLQGYQADATGALLANVSDLNIAQASSAPLQTENIRINLNLDADESIEPPRAPIGSTYSTAITVYDSLGTAIPLTLEFTKTASSTWDYTASIPPGQGTVTAGAGTLTFDDQGLLTGVTGDETISINPSTGGAAFDVNWDIYDDVAGLATTDITGYSEQSDVSALFQDGYGPGTVQNVSIEQDGTIVGLFTNGQTRTIGQVLVADFVSPWGLTKMGKSLFAESMSSGQATIGVPGSGGRGRIASNSLEMSNVDMASEFVRMITTQRAYQANARVISTSDELLAELMNIKR
jgi:flagellar hook protein FlgE